jgi:hypothetical protein
MHLVADQLAQLPWQCPREFGRNVEIVLFLAQPSEGVGQKHAVAPLIRSIRARPCGVPLIQTSTEPAGISPEAISSAGCRLRIEVGFKHAFRPLSSLRG